MTKAEFAAALRHRLEYLPSEETERFVSFYLELIDDRIEDGFDEDAAVAASGELDKIVADIEAELPPVVVPPREPESETSERDRQKRGKGGRGPWIFLAALGAPVSVPLLAAVAVVALAVLVCVLAAVVTVAAVWCSVLACGVAALVYIVMRFAVLGTAGAVFMAGLALACIGAGLALIWPLWAFIKLLARLVYGAWQRLKRKLTKRGGAEI